MDALTALVAQNPQFQAPAEMTYTFDEGRGEEEGEGAGEGARTGVGRVVGNGRRNENGLRRRAGRLSC
ncbi:hypothetical protein NJL88_41920, partial [Streptomyces sp. DK15]|nr:hypothetical protein [Streptomyces sp. DK15]